MGLANRIIISTLICLMQTGVLFSQEQDSINGIYIPTDINDCINQLNSFWNDSIRTEISKMERDEFAGTAHFGIGLWMRNNWGLWSGSRLSEYFNELGIDHPDDMSGIILDSYYSELTNTVFNLDSAIAYYIKYWEQNPVYDKHAEPVGGHSQLPILFQENMQLTNDQIVPGRVFVQCNIGANGKASNFKVIKGINSLLDEEAMRLVQLVEEWTPAELEGQKVESQVVIPVIFKKKSP